MNDYKPKYLFIYHTQEEFDKFLDANYIFDSSLVISDRNSSNVTGLRIMEYNHYQLDSMHIDNIKCKLSKLIESRSNRGYAKITITESINNLIMSTYGKDYLSDILYPRLYHSALGSERIEIFKMK